MDGVPAPNPSFPQDIHVVTGNNSVGVQGKNLWDGTYQPATVGGNNGRTYQVNTVGSTAVIPCLPSTTYTIKKYETSNRFRIYDYPTQPVGGDSLNVLVNSDSSDVLTITTNADANYLVIYVSTSSEQATPKMQVELGQTATSYVPYYHADYPINLGSLELCKIGDYQDYLYKENGNWYKYGAINKSVLNGTEANWSMSDNIIVCQAISNYSISNNVPFVNYFKGTPNKSNGSTLLNNEACFNNNVNYSRFYIKTDKFENIADFKTWLSTNNLIVYYITRNATTTQITDETLIAQLDAIYEHLQLVKGTNNITVTASDLAPYMELSYMQDLKSKLDNLDSRLALLE